MLEIGKAYKWVNDKTDAFWVDGNVISIDVLNKNDIFILTDYKDNDIILPMSMKIKQQNLTIVFNNKKCYIYIIFSNENPNIDHFLELVC